MYINYWYDLILIFYNGIYEPLHDSLNEFEIFQTLVKFGYSILELSQIVAGLLTFILLMYMLILPFRAVTLLLNSIKKKLRL